MHVRLVVEEDRTRKHVFHVRTPTAVVGRARGCAVRIPSSDVSRRHCRLHLKDGYVAVEDLASVNGTFLNGDPIKGTTVVRPGDRLEVGPVTFVVEYDLTPDALERLMKDDYEVVAEEADADVQDVTEAEVIADDDVPEADVIDDETWEEAEEAPAEEEVFPVEAGPWRPPEGGDLRDLLAQLEEGEEEDSPQRRKGHKAKKKPPPPPDDE